MDSTEYILANCLRLTRDQAVRYLDSLMQHRTVTACINFVNTNLLAAAVEDTDIGSHVRASHNLVDGVGAMSLARIFLGLRFPENLNGTDFVPYYLKNSAVPLTVHLIGGEDGVAVQASARFKNLAPQHSYKVIEHGYYDAEREGHIFEAVRKDRPDLLLVAMGTPKQENFMARQAVIGGPAVVIGVGALFDFMSGRVRRAPSWMRQLKAEWLFRLFLEPRRLAHRYLVLTPKLFATALAQFVSRRKTRTRRIVLVLSHDEAGGALNIWDQLGDGLQERGYIVSKYVVHRKTKIEHPQTWDRILEGGATLASMPLAVLRLSGILRKHRADAVISALPVANVVSSLAGWLAGVPRRITSHHSPARTYGAGQRLTDKYIGGTQIVTNMVSVSNGVLNSFAGYPPSYMRKMSVIKNALSPTVRQKIADLNASDRISSEGAYIVAVGRLAKQKNYEVLLRAMALIPDVTLWIVGEGPDDLCLKTLATTHALSNVVFLGHQSHSETLKIMANAALFVQPSLFEGHSIALLEAACLGLPIVVSDVPTQVEAVTSADGETCATIASPADSPGQLAKAITAALSSPARLAELSKKIALEAQFDRMVDAYAALLLSTEVATIP